MATIAQNVIGSCPVWLPPLVEQVKIVEFVDRAMRRLVDAVKAARNEIDLTREYRTRLIADVVTGKLDVREAAARLRVETKETEEAEVDDALVSDEGGTESDDGAAEEAAGEET